MPTGLEKLTVEIPFIKGQLQKFSQQVTEMDAPYYMRNVHLRKASSPEKRVGHTAHTAAYDGAVAMTSTTKRAVSLDGELVAITESTGNIGSGGGAASGGDTVFAFSEGAQKWKAFGKIQRPTLDVLYPIQTHRETLQRLDTAVGSFSNVGEQMLTAEDTGSSGHLGLFLTVTDLASNTERLQTVIGAHAGDKIIKCVATTSFLCIVWHNATAGTFHLTTVHPTTLATNQYDFGIGDSAGADNADAAVNGNDIFVSYTVSTTEVRVIKISSVDGSTSSAASVEIFASGTQKPTAISIGNGELQVVYKRAASHEIKIRTTTNLAPSFSGAALDIATNSLMSDVRVISVSGEVRLVFWQTAYDATTETTYAGGNLSGSGTAASVYWARIEGPHTALVNGWSAATRRAVNVGLWGQPFILSGRVFLPVVGLRHVVPGQGVSAMGYYKGAYLTEVEPTVSSAQATLMPHAACCLDVVGQTLGRNTSVVSNKVYTAITRRRTDPGDPNSRLWYFEHLQAQVIVLNFADEYRWHPAIHDHMVIFGGAYPYVYDGKATHECGFAWRPEILGYEIDAGGSLDANATYNYRVTYEYRDAVGRRWHSQPSYATEADTVNDPTGGNLTVKVSVSALSLNMMQDAGFYFPGILYAVLWRATAANAASGRWIRDIQKEIHPYDTGNVTLSSSASDNDIAEAEQLYIVGGELENYTAPPCRSICQHRDRLVAFNTEWKTLDYTKPLQQDRGIEWSLSQRIPCPEDIVAIESMEHVCVAFAKKRIYALEGAGPGPTGIPPDAFARLVLVNADIGCSETNAAWRCPAGIIFQSNGGFWLLDRGLNVSYIGAPVEHDFDEVSSNLRALCGVIDEKNNCLRIYYYKALGDIAFSDGYSSQTVRYNYWFDTGRWSVDTLQFSAPQWATYHLNKNYVVCGSQSSSGIAYEDSSVYTDISTFYAETIETGWIRFGDLSSFKRVWRLLASFEKVGDGTKSDLRWKISADFDDHTASGLISDSSFGSSSGPELLRVHLPRQKVRVLKVTLVESQGITANSQGFRFHGIGFELGMKRGAFKAASVST